MAKPKREKIGFLEFYFGWVISLGNATADVIIAILHLWYCGYCDKYHGPRVRKYMDQYHNDVCSIGAAAYKDSAIESESKETIRNVPMTFNFTGTFVKDEGPRQ